MDVGDQSRARIRDRLARLESTYGSFPVNQTTLSVPAETYDRAVERASYGLADVSVEVRNGEGQVLVVPGEDSWQIPEGRTEAGESLEDGARRQVRDVAGVDVGIEEIVRATIAGIRKEGDPNATPVYRLVVVFEGVVDEEISTENVKWQEPDRRRARPR